MSELDQVITRMENDFESKPMPILSNSMKNSIQRIIDALTAVDCTSCVALIVAKQELKKFKGVS